ncbi:hypothetical protein PFICI_10099 [Pestalotiopsis fici W106-1]|uniref:DSBA-like thioredoxin domain-containing protein n=1 Tax=Pestalotiopsis fici (strain W106-1 / CGMCC3.15140) TaxID=1229662 RepID=W3WY08_PESFW|nr:uncharacterized protein PFICI_10099 [Pestalotiopsis fici W106-1]ETS78037.1 hypothetical protein PFICI_10099 [Pestalotiopsis fici W106-1]
MTSIQDLLSPVESKTSQGSSPPADRKQHSTSNETSHFTIEFILDTICPHCYIGLRNLNTAIDLYKKQHANATFEVTCSPIILNPVAGRSVDIKGNYYQHTRHFAPSTIERWTRQGAEIGINFDWLGGWTGNSRDSHKLLRLALGPWPSAIDQSSSSTATQPSGHPYSSSSTSATDTKPSTSEETTQGRPGARGPQTQMELVSTIYREYFENNRDVSNRSWLLSLGTSLLPDVPPGEIQACLESEAWDAAIDRLSDQNRQRFNAVPVFVIQGRFVAGGWQSPEKFLEVFERIRVAEPNAPGMTLSPPGGGWWESGVFRGAGQQQQQGPSDVRSAGGCNVR